MTEAEWDDTSRLSLGMLLNGEEIPEHTAEGLPIRGDTLLVILHAHHEDVEWRLPPTWPGQWEVVLDTAQPASRGTGTLDAGSSRQVAARSLLVLRRL